MQNIAEKSYDKRGYELISYLENEIVELFIEYGVSERNAHEYSYHFIQIILDELKQYDTDKALESYLEIWRKQSVQNYFSLKKQLDAMEAPAFIIIGGNTLSRGLTLEGLVSTYFFRKGRQADSLMQMGRWFGYRKGYDCQ